MPFGAHAVKSMTFCQATWKPQCGYCTAIIQNNHDCIMCLCMQKRPVSNYRPLFICGKCECSDGLSVCGLRVGTCSKARRFEAMLNTLCFGVLESIQIQFADGLLLIWKQSINQVDCSVNPFTGRMLGSLTVSVMSCELKSCLANFTGLIIIGRPVCLFEMRNEHRQRQNPRCRRQHVLRPRH